MTAAEIRRNFLAFFEANGHEIRPSAPLVPEDDPTLLFVNAGMVPFKRAFLGMESLPYRRATTSQKCVRAGGKHNDLEQVGITARHHTFFEMLGNFSFGDYFKEEAIRLAWEFLTVEMGLEAERLYITVHHTDEEAAELWRTVAGVPSERIFYLGDEDNFWQMADTGPCGPCSELHYDLRPVEERQGPVARDVFIEKGEQGLFIELWNLVFMQFDRDAEGTLNPLPAPSIDTGAGLERLAAVIQGADSNYHTDLFLPLLERVAEVVGRPYGREAPEGVSFRVLADHARAVTFLLADGVFPASEGRGYVLRRILRRGVRHAWLLGRREPTLAPVVEAVIETMAEAYPELLARREHLLRTTRAEEERFLATIEGGMDRFELLAPPVDERMLEEVAAGNRERPTIPGDEVFRLYDTFGFPLDLTQTMAAERGYEVDVEGFEVALERQRARSRADRAATGPRVASEELEEGWVVLRPGTDQEFVGYTRTELETDVVAFRQGEGRLGVQLRENPFYAEGGGQVSDRGEVLGDGWRLDVDEVRRVGGRVALFGDLDGSASALEEGEAPVVARVESAVRRDTERNHTATHLLHAALRKVLGGHVVQRGSLVTPDRLRFDFAHHAPLTVEEIREVEELVNEAIWADHPLRSESTTYDEAVARGAMALFGEKYGDAVRLVEIPGVSLELCGGTHVRHTGEAGLFIIPKESGVAAGVRRIEALTGPGAFRHLRRIEVESEEVAALLRTSPANLRPRVERLLEEKSEIERLLEELRAHPGSGAGAEVVREVELELDGHGKSSYRALRLEATGPDDVRGFGDGFLASGVSGVVLVAAHFPDGKRSLFTFVTDDLIQKGIRADAFVREVAALVGSRGGGRPHMAQAGVENPEKLDEALLSGEEILLRLAGRGA